jgi:capsular exopolysaccharide synthesis family protein
LNKTNQQDLLAQQEVAELSLRDYWETILRYRATFIMVIVAFLFASISIFAIKPKRYGATAKLISINPNANATSLERMMGRVHTTLIEPSTISRMAQANGTLEIAHKYALNEFAQLEQQYDIKMEEKFIAKNLSHGQIASAMSVDQDSLSIDIINIHISMDESPHLCSAIANGVSKAILDILTENNSKTFRLEIKNLENSIKKNELEIKLIDQKIKKILSQESGFQLGLDEDKLTQRLSLLERQLNDADLRKKEIQDQIIVIKADFGIEHVPIEQVRWIDLSSIMHQKLQNLKFEREELLTRYHEENPSVKKINNQIKSLEETLKPVNEDENIVYVEVDRFKSGVVTRLLQLLSEKSAVEKRYQHIQLELKDVQNKILKRPEAYKEIEKLRKKMAIIEKIQINLHTSLQTSKMNLLSTSSNFEILEKAHVQNASSDGFMKYSLFGLAVGSVLAFIIVMVLKNWENTLKCTGDFKRHLSYPSLGGIPRWKYEEMYIDEMQPDAHIAEVYGVIRNHIRFSSHNQPEKSLLVCSAFQGEGKSLTSMNLALSFALEGNQVLLVSADLRRTESLVEFLDDKKDLGIVEYLEEQVELKDVLHPSLVSNLHIVPTIHRANNPTKLLKKKRFKDLLDYGESNYDVMIIDSPAILPVVDTTMFANLTRGVMVIAQADNTPITAIKETITRLEHVEAPIIGVCLNNIVDLRLEFQYNYGDKHRYEYLNS